MSKTEIIKVSVCCLILMMIFPALTQAQMALGIKAGTAGVGGEFTTSLHEDFNARLSGTFFSYEHSGVYADDESSIAYDAKVDIASIGAIIDYFPFKRSLKLSGGIIYHDFSVEGGAAPNESYTMGDKMFEPERLGSLSANIGYKSKIVPYAGIGWGNPIASGSAIKLNLEIGSMYTNSPKVTMEGEGMIAPTASQDQDFEDGIKEFKFYPVVNLGLSFRF